MKKVLMFLAALALTLAAAAGVIQSMAPPALAAEGDLYAPGTTYWATTYTGHVNYHEWPDAPREYVVDLHAAADAGGAELGNDGNYRLPIHAPGDGTVRQVSEGYGGGWGNSIMWTSSDGREEIHIAHLDEVARTGPVHAGDLIAYEGSTGHSSPSDFNHLHVSRRVDGAVAPVELSGTVLQPDPSSTTRASQRVYEAQAVALPPTPVPDDAFGFDGIRSAIREARKESPESVGTVLVSTEDAVTQAVTSAPLLDASDAPVLLTNAEALQSPVRAELQRLEPVRVIVVGLGPAAQRAIRSALPRAQVTNAAEVLS